MSEPKMLSEKCRTCDKRETCPLINADTPLPLLPPELLKLAIVTAIINAELTMMEEGLKEMEAELVRRNQGGTQRSKDELG